MSSSFIAGGVKSLSIVSSTSPSLGESAAEHERTKLFAFTLQPDVAVVITVYISTRHKSITLIFVAYGICANVYYALRSVARMLTPLAYFAARKMYVLHLWDIQLSP